MRTKRIAVLLVSLCMLLGVLPGIAFAYEAGARLGEKSQATYDELKTQIAEAASGARTSTDFVIERSGFKALWSPEELGINESDYADYNAMIDAAMDQLSIVMTEAFLDDPAGDADRIVNALLADMPYELYWYDKTAGVSYGLQTSVGAMYDGYGWKVYPSSYDPENPEDTVTIVYSFSMTVSQNYGSGTVLAQPGTIDLPVLDIILSDSSGKSDYQKISAYADAICDLVTYNDAARDDDSMPYGDPWQLVFVFDGDDSTNVVCEGYSKAFKYLCDLSSPKIDCQLVSGMMTGGTGAGPHMWNTVTLNGKNYLVDVTNIDSGHSLLLRGGPEENGTYTFEGITYEYDDETLSTWTGTPDVLTLAEEDYAPPLVYTIYIEESDHGTVTADKSEAAKDETVTLTVTPDEGYELDTLTVTMGDGEPVDVAADNTFVMPENDVHVEAVFRELPITAPTFTGRSVLLTGEIGLNFYVTVPEGFDADGAKIVMTVNGKDTEIAWSDGQNAGTNQKYFTCPLNSLEMGDTVTAVFTWGDGGEITSAYSVAEYVEYVTGHPDDYSGNAVALAEAIADYGHYVAPFVEEYGKTDGLDHNGIEARNDMSGEIFRVQDAAADYALTKELNESGVTLSYTLNLEAKTSVYLYIKAEDGVSVYGALVDYEDVTLENVTMDGEAYKRIRIGNIFAGDLGRAFEVYVVTDHGLANITVSALSYVNTILSSDSFNNNSIAQQAMAAFYRYYEAAAAYKSNPNG